MINKKNYGASEVLGIFLDHPRSKTYRRRYGQGSYKRKKGPHRSAPFFEICKAKGMNGNQGVVIPASNAKHLMLKEEVVEAVREGKFNVWTAGTIDEGIEILTGKQASEKKNGVYEEGSVNDLVDRQLRILSETLKEFAGPAGKKPAEGQG
jgi:hypothetical protein